MLSKDCKGPLQGCHDLDPFVSLPFDNVRLSLKLWDVHCGFWCGCGFRLEAVGFQDVRCKVLEGFSILRANEGLEWVAVKELKLLYHSMGI